MPNMVNVYDAKTQLSRLLTHVERGEEIIIARHGKPVAKLGPLAPQRGNRRPGAWKGKVAIAADFDDFTAEDDSAWYAE